MPSGHCNTSCPGRPVRDDTVLPCPSMGAGNVVFPPALRSMAPVRQDFPALAGMSSTEAELFAAAALYAA